MKVIKRDGRVVDFDREKISVAIEKANREDLINQTNQELKVLEQYLPEPISIEKIREEAILLFYLFASNLKF